MSTEPRGKGILHKSITGGTWLTLGYVVERVLSVISFFILARLLTPQDFGTLAIIFLVPRFIQSVSELGFSAAVIQKGGVMKPYLDAIWSIRLTKATVVAVVMAVGGSLIANFFNIPEAATAVRLGGIILLIYNFSNIGEVYFFKELDFKKVFLRNLARQLAYLSVAVAVATITKSYWALVAGTAAQYIAEVIATYLLHPYRPAFTWHWRPLKTLMGYGKWIFGQGIIDQTYGFLEQAMVGKFTGVTNTGFYSKAKNLAAVAPGFLTSVITMVSFPAYAKLKEELHKVREGLLKSVDLIGFFVMPVIFLIFIAGGKIILLLLGEQWLPMTGPLRVLLLYFAMGSIVEIGYKLLSGIGRPDVKVKLDTVKIIVTIPLIAILTRLYGIIGTAWALTLGLTPVFIFILIYLTRCTPAKLREILERIALPGVVLFILTLPALALKGYLVDAPLVPLLGLITLLGLAYLATIVYIGKRWQRGPYATIRVILYHLGIV